MKIILFLFLFFMTCPIFSQDYNFDISKFKKKSFEFSSTAEFRPSCIFLEKENLSWKLKYYNKNNSPDFIDTYLLLIEPITKYEKNGLLFYCSGDIRIAYNNFENDCENDTSLLEGYGKYEFNSRWNINFGKKLYKWGKGYIYNPMSYAGRQKDVNDTDASLEGYYSASLEYIRSFSSKIIKNLSHEFVFIPVLDNVNNDYGKGDNNWLFSRSHFLIVNTDYEFIFAISEDFDYKAGAAAAYNIFTNWAVHGEISFLPETEKMLIAGNGCSELQTINNTIQSIIGTRYLSPFNATFFLEYIYNESGLTKQEMQDWYISAESILDTHNTAAINSISKEWFLNMNKQFIMKDYLYFKMQYPEPFNFLYCTPSVYSLFNIVDKSFLGGVDVDYKRFSNFSFNIKLFGFGGRKRSEFGSKISELKAEVRVKYFY
ncbi:hypothetical protein ACFL4O_03085 [bacterium]